ncbi:MAG: hypothetical protein C0507_05380 [Cyanobacteria bacterium PR.3.49]|nr:hypothetical protein [Cyanobacteria bacterium PR.3.49]
MQFFKEEPNFDDAYVDTSHGRMHALVSRSANQPATNYVLVHGLLVSASYMEPTARFLAEKNNVFVPNMLGHGKSATPDRALDINEHACVLAEFLTSKNISNPVLVGGSYGCNIATELAANPEVNAQALILIGPTDVFGRSVQELLGDLITDGLYEPSIMVPTVIADVGRIGMDRCLAQLKYMAEHDMDDALLRITAPILFIKGENDKLSSEDVVRDKFEIAPHAQALNVLGSAHCLTVSDPQLMAAMIVDFVEQGPLADSYLAA